MDLKILDGFYPTEGVVTIGIYDVLFLASPASSGGIWVLFNLSFVVFDVYLTFSIIGYIKLIWYICCPRLGISYFSRNP